MVCVCIYTLYIHIYVKRQDEVSSETQLKLRFSEQQIYETVFMNRDHYITQNQLNLLSGYTIEQIYTVDSAVTSIPYLLHCTQCKVIKLNCCA